MTHPYGDDPQSRYQQDQYQQSPYPPAPYSPAQYPPPAAWQPVDSPAPGYEVAPWPGSAPQYAHPQVIAGRTPRSVGAAIALEIVPGLFGVFGIGNIYAGSIGVGIALMVSFWVFFWINVLLVFIFIGWVTAPLTWIAYVVAGSILASRAVEKRNAGY